MSFFDSLFGTFGSPRWFAVVVGLAVGVSAIVLVPVTIVRSWHPGGHNHVAAAPSPSPAPSPAFSTDISQAAWKACHASGPAPGPDVTNWPSLDGYAISKAPDIPDSEVSPQTLRLWAAAEVRESSIEGYVQSQNEGKVLKYGDCLGPTRAYDVNFKWEVEQIDTRLTYHAHWVVDQDAAPGSLRLVRVPAADQAKVLSISGETTRYAFVNQIHGPSHGHAVDVLGHRVPAILDGGLTAGQVATIVIFGRYNDPGAGGFTGLPGIWYQDVGDACASWKEVCSQ